MYSNAAVLSDIIQSEGVTVVALTEVFRQTQQSSIITNAHSINQGLTPLLPPRKNQNQDSGVDNTDYSQNQESNNLLVEAFGNCFRVKDKVMQTANDYDKDVYNSDIGTIIAIDRENQEVIISFDNRRVNYEYSELDEIVHAYATTIHKSQSSEYYTVVIPLMMQHYLMLQCDLIYTAVTSAKKLVIIVGERKALNVATGKASASSRYSTLKRRLLELTGWY